MLCYDGSKYVKWYELDPDDPNPIYVPSLGVFHPSTIPLSELSNSGNGKISVDFVAIPRSGDQNDMPQTVTLNVAS